MENFYKSKIGIKGRVELKLFGPDGNLKDSRVIKDIRVLENTITTFMDKTVANRMSGSVSGTVPSHMAIGTGSGMGASNNAVATELDRNALTSANQDSGSDDNDVIYVGDWAAGDGTGAITEAGLMSAASGPGMYAYASFSAINKAAGDTLQINWTITYGAS